MSLLDQLQGFPNKARDYVGNTDPGYGGMFGLALGGLAQNDPTIGKTAMANNRAQYGIDAPNSGPFQLGNYQGGASYGAAQQNADLARLRMMDPNADAQSRAAQSGLLRQLQLQASGQAPSLAAMQAQQAGQANQAQALGMLASNRGLNPGMAARMAGQQLGTMGAQTAAAAAQARLAEQMQAQGLMGQVSGQMRGQDMAGTQFNASAYDQALQQALDRQYGLQGQQNQGIAQMEAQRRNALPGMFAQGVGTAANAGAALLPFLAAG